jgi:hypothetical protein
MQKCGIFLTMTLKNTHCCDILFYMSQINAHFNKNPQILAQKVPMLNKQERNIYHEKQENNFMDRLNSNGDNSGLRPAV